MSRIFTISDLHLSFGCDKPMDVFKGWENYTERIYTNWQRCVKKEDTVVLAGDTSWSSDLETALADFKFLHSLNGTKILLKGNHDFWWTTSAKLNSFLEQHGFDDIKILHNNTFACGKYGICGTRGWVYDGKTADKKIILRECGRLDTSLTAAENAGLCPIVFLHYPHAYGEFVCEEIAQTLARHGIKRVYHGHIHGAGRNNSLKEWGGVELKLISCDCIDFTPHFICEF